LERAVVVVEELAAGHLDQLEDGGVLGREAVGVEVDMSVSSKR